MIKEIIFFYNIIKNYNPTKGGGTLRGGKSFIFKRRRKEIGGKNHT